jgi:hypothetical protein
MNFILTWMAGAPCSSRAAGERGDFHVCANCSSFLAYDLLPRSHHLRTRSLEILMRLPKIHIPMIPDPREKFLCQRNILESHCHQRILIQIRIRRTVKTFQRFVAGGVGLAASSIHYPFPARFRLYKLHAT